MSNTFAGVSPEQELRPAFTVKKLPGALKVNKHRFDPKTNKVVSKEVEVDAGYLVTFSKGHSIRALDKEHLKRVGAGARLVPLLNQNGDVVGQAHNVIVGEDAPASAAA